MRNYVLFNLYDRILVLRRSQESDPDSFSEFMLMMSIQILAMKENRADQKNKFQIFDM